MSYSLAGRIRMCIDEAKENPWSQDSTMITLGMPRKNKNSESAINRKTPKFKQGGHSPILKKTDKDKSEYREKRSSHRNSSSINFSNQKETNINKNKTSTDRLSCFIYHYLK